MGSVTGIATALVLLWGATNVFNQLREALNTVWDVPPKSGQGIMNTVINRALAFFIMMMLGLMLSLSLIASAALDVLSRFLPRVWGTDIVWSVMDVALFLVLLTLLYALVLKVLPDNDVAWRDIWLGALTTALFFIVGRELLSWYLRQQRLSSFYGAAGSLFVFLIWMYYSAQIFFIGAEFTKVYAEWRAGRAVAAEELADT
jgi:membrane protein